MKKVKLLVAEIVLLVILAVFSVVMNKSKGEVCLEAGTFGNMSQNKDFSDLVDRFYSSIV